MTIARASPSGPDVGEVQAFLAVHPPFDALADAARRELASAAVMTPFGTGQLALVEDGAPARGLYVIFTGSMDIVHEGEAIQVLEPGECFGHPSLLTGMAPAFTVRAREESVCALLPAAPSRRALGTEAGAAYVAETLRKRLTRAGHTVHGLLDVGTTPVSAIARPAVFCEPETTIREAALALGEEGVSALLVRVNEEELGLVTDADVRACVASGTLELGASVRGLARSPVPTTPVGQLAVVATVDMLAAGENHLAVLDGGHISGMLSAADLLGLDARSPIALRHTILGAADEDVLASAASHLPQLFRLLVQAGVPPRDIGRVLSLQHDALVARLIDFSLALHGPAPTPWAWLDLGSAARREFTLASDQDNALAYGETPPEDAAGVDDYFARVGREVNAGLARCGFGVDNNGVLAGDRRWRMSKPDWLSTFDECLREPDESHLIRATVSFDFRPAAGGLAITAALAERIRAAREQSDFMRLMARTATGYPVALGFRGQLAVEKHGPAAGRVDLKRGAIIPLVNLVRFHAMANGVTISPTLDRIDAVASAGGIDAGLAEALREAFDVITRLRFEHHAACIAAGAPADNLLDPDALAPIARGDLREALHSVRRAQKLLAVWAH
ncbi:MAG TPA: putative nucleotidyltransferase substrate binding domain-containing protein [Solirubrobacteraceae bacterium]|nr:putative nucleotidyltransferase substrate binding domain-containing protein [Solirubrobacteraceae bacterium]